MLILTSLDEEAVLDPGLQNRVLANLGAILGLSWDHVCCSWAAIGLSWLILGPSWELLAQAHAATILGTFLLILTSLGEEAVLDPCLQNKVLAHLGAILGLSWDHVWFSRAAFGLSWLILGPSWEHLGSSWLLLAQSPYRTSKKHYRPNVLEYFLASKMELKLLQKLVEFLIHLIIDFRNI